ncbi:hypothetical protein G5B47_02655 [Paenibacillus sp. 7124]|uniref:Uncharacterized protein n=1 Tax=Paenibacillus apii TaxID=1850370 RepID=A0A6M1PDE9_9BACL|nr:hypothetical protein [Paenibacillus apii]NGM81309.1 hypothetical protein [Paenibacillus apii]
MKKQVEIAEILNHCEVSKKAIIIKAELEFFLMTDEDRVLFIQEFDSRNLVEHPKKPFRMMDLAKEIGSNHHTYVSLEQLKEMELQRALECLFVEPINHGAMFHFKESGASLRRLYELKQANPKYYLMDALMYA